MIARCDGEHLGELDVLKVSKEKMTLGPMMISARIDQDQTISKDLSMWNQQGSKVIRGQVLVLPVNNTFLYVEPIYLKASQARMPQLQKVVLGMGERIVYADTYDQALAELAGTPVNPSPAPSATPSPLTTTTSSSVLQTIRDHLKRYRELAGQGRWAEAGKELEAIDSAVK
jgi:uncharacterized membrane protein (UPF0182 family)